MDDLRNKILQGDCLEILKTIPDGLVNCCITSPPYFGLRDYGIDGQIGLEKDPEQYIQKLVEVFREVKRVLKDDGTLWVNIGDTYNGNKVGNTETVKHSVVSDTNNFRKQLWAGAKKKDLIGIPWMLAFALRNDGWYLRQDIIWHKTNPMPEPVKDRCVKSHEYIFLLSKKPRYYFDYEAIQEEATGYDGRKDTLNKGSQKYSTIGYMPNQNHETTAGRSHERWQFSEDENGNPIPIRNKRDVWSVPTKASRDAHFATFPEELITPCILAACPKGGIVLDVFFGSGTTGRVASSNGRDFIGIELNPEYIELAEKKTTNNQMTIFSIL